MKNGIRVIRKQLPKHGKHVGEGTYEYFVTPDGLPAMHFRWRGLVFNGSKTIFVFPRDVVKIGRIPDDVAKSHSRSSGFFEASYKGGVAGIVGSLVSGAIGAAAAPTANIKGFGVHYRNEDGNLGVFIAVAPGEIVDEIFRSVPKENQFEDTPPSSSPQATQPPNP